jgi:putative copper resistance protein D
VGAIVLFVAASLTSLPVAADVKADRAAPAEVLERFTPRMPSLTSPALAEMPIADRAAPRTDADRGWSEYNHHVAGAFVLAMGLLAMLHGTGRAPWARHWPLVFLGLASFMLVRNDPGAWPLGPIPFWQSLGYPEVLQHKFFVVLVATFGLFEWRVRARRDPRPRIALVFPALCAVGGSLLLVHSHAALNLKEEFLTEVTHVPLGLLSLAVGIGRWLELRLPAGEGRVPGRLSAWALTLVGVALLLYRES